MARINGSFEEDNEIEAATPTSLREKSSELSCFKQHTVCKDERESTIYIPLSIHFPCLYYTRFWTIDDLGREVRLYSACMYRCEV